MVIKTVKDIPECIKNIVELFYTGRTDAAYDEANRVKASDPECKEFVEVAVAMFANAPESMYSFYEDFVSKTSSMPDQDDGFDLLDIFSETNDSSDEDLDFLNLLNASLDSNRAAQPPKNDPANDSLEASNRHAPLELGSGIDLNIDVELSTSVLPEPAVVESHGYSGLLTKPREEMYGVNNNAPKNPPPTLGASAKNLFQNQSSGLISIGKAVVDTPEKSASADFSLSQNGLNSSDKKSISALTADLFSSQNFDEGVASQQRTPARARPVPNDINGVFDEIEFPDDLMEVSAPSSQNNNATSTPFSSLSKQYLRPAPNDVPVSIKDSASQLPKASAADATPVPSAPERKNHENSSEFSFNNISNNACDPLSGHRRVTADIISTDGIPGSGFGRFSMNNKDSELGLRNRRDIRSFQHSEQERPTMNRLQAVTLDSSRATSISLEAVPTPIKLTPVVQTKDSTGDALEDLQPFTRMPRLLLSMSELARRTDIDSRAGYLLSLIDGVSSIGDILSLSAWPQNETAQILCNLRARKIIEFD